MISPYSTRPQSTSRHRSPHTTIHPQVPTLNRLIKRRTERKLVVRWMCHDPCHRLFMPFKGVGHCLAVDVHELDGVVIAAG